MNKKINNTFTGTVDEFLEHCNGLQFDISEEEIKAREYESAISYLMEKEKIDREEAITLYNMIALEEVTATVDKLVKEGLLEVREYSESGEPMFGLTDFGTECVKEIKKQKKTKSVKSTHSSKKKK